jgi:AcrR family transcriptional regulator
MRESSGRKHDGGARAAPETRGVRVGGRSKRVVSDVLKAAAAELAARGYIGFRVEEVAAAAGVNKTTVYRRWPTKAALVEAALDARAPHLQAPPDTGSLEGDLVALLRRELRWQRTPEGAGIVRMLLLDAKEAELRRIVATLRERGQRVWLAAIEAGKARGDIPPDVDAVLLAQMVAGPALLRQHQSASKLDGATMTTIVRIAILGARGDAERGGARASPRR